MKNKSVKKSKNIKNKSVKKSKNIKIHDVSRHNVNGYNVLLVNIPKSDLIYIQSYVNTGFLFETEKNSGINHLLEHVLVNSWDQCKKYPCLEVLSNKGIQCNAHTGLTNVNYHITTTKDYINEMLEYIITITTKAKITKKNISIEVNPVINELKQYASEPSSKLIDVIQKEMFCSEGGKYADDWELQIKNLKHLNETALKKYYEEHYIPEKTSFIICGNINKTNVLSVVEELLPDTKCNSSITINYNKCFNIFKDNKYLFDKNHDRKNALCVFKYCVPSFGDKILLNFSLSCLRHELFHQLRYKKKLVYYLSCNTYTSHCGYIINISYETGINKIKISHDSILSTIEKYKNNFFSNKVISSRKKHQIINFEKQNINNPEYIANHYLNQFVFKQTQLESPKSVFERTKKITKHDIKKTMNTCFNNYIFGYQSTKKVF